ncbi:MAG: C40 family peptidase [Aquificaceae bacterium]|nr:C40 family peptidase [Aquificaceae bacterium]MCS7278412.1 C40 family peptidase [Aquificaceae bacterium]MDW8423693.1 C40 family peptidase [Aquificaceae bacterium]
MRGGIIGVLLSVCMSFANPEGIVLTALTYMQRPYQFGANELYRMDCSAFVQRVFEVNGIRLPRSTKEQAQAGIPIDTEELLPGDLLFYSTYRKGPSHVGIYIGNGKMVHASERSGITVSRIDEPYWQSRFLFARRVLKTPLLVHKKVEENKQAQKDEIGDLIYILSGWR